MSKISIVLSVILVVSGIGASNAEDFNVSLEECKKSIADVRTYVTNTYKDSKVQGTASVQKTLSDIIDEIERNIPLELPESTVSHDQKIPSGEHIKCNDTIAKLLSFLIGIADETVKE